MGDLTREIQKLEKPDNIQDALCASSPYVLRKAFERDRTVIKAIRAGRDVVPLLERELSEKGLALPDISLACLVYVLEQIDPTSPPASLRALLRRATENPGPFFVNFATHWLRRAAGLPVRPLEMVYRAAEVREALRTD